MIYLGVRICILYLFRGQSFRNNDLCLVVSLRIGSVDVVRCVTAVMRGGEVKKTNEMCVNSGFVSVNKCVC